MLITEKKYQNTIIFSLKGRLDNKGASVLESKFDEYSDNNNSLLLNLDGVDYLSSIGIRALIKIDKALRQKGGELFFCNLSDNIKQVLNISGLLNLFKVFENEANVISHLDNSKSVSTEFSFNEINFSAEYFEAHKSFIETWASANDEVNQLSAVNLNELGLAFGIAGMGSNANEASNETGNFLSTGKVVGVTPAGESFHPDFNISVNPEETILYISKGIGFDGNYSLRIKIKSDKCFTLSEFLPELLNKLISDYNKDFNVAGIVLAGKADKINGSFFSNKNEIIKNNPTGKFNGTNKNIISAGILSIDNSKVVNTNTQLILDYFLLNNKLNDKISIYSSSILLDSQFDVNLKNPENINDHLTLDNLDSTIINDLSTSFIELTLWLYLPVSIRSGEEKRLQIELRNCNPLSDNEEIITRRIYSDSSKVILETLSGGFSANTYRVFSYDKQGRELLPTVMKIGMKDWINREISAYHNYVKKFILNNSTTILGTTELDDKAGLRYNFLGITGSEGKLSMLRDLYPSLSNEKLNSIFIKVFTNILKPWYGQPKWEVSYPYADHNPLRIFKNICEDAENILGISSDEEKIYCDELGKELPNPYHFLKYQYETRKNDAIHWYKSVIHGDLNLANIMLDDNDNIYIIDFSETRESNIVSDLGRIEPIVKIEMSKIENDNDLKDFLLFEYQLSRINKIDDLPEFVYNGDDKMIEKAYSIIKLFRNFAGKMTIFETNPVPYFLAILEWTFPMVSYRNFPVIKKKASAYSAAIMIEQILNIEK